jgi:hypothetical protein
MMATGGPVSSSSFDEDNGLPKPILPERKDTKKYPV